MGPCDEAASPQPSMHRAGLSPPAPQLTPDRASLSHEGKMGGDHLAARWLGLCRATLNEVEAMSRDDGRLPVVIHCRTMSGFFGGGVGPSRGPLEFVIAFTCAHPTPPHCPQ